MPTKPQPNSTRKSAAPRKRVRLDAKAALAGAAVGPWREAMRRPRATKRVGWGLFHEDVRRGRLISLAGLAILSALAASFATAPDYVVAGVTVQGTNALSPAEATRLAAVTGQNIFMVNPQAVAARLIQAAFIKSVTV